ncbi:N-acetylglutamate kinase [Sphingobacterium allocomposti]|jgi:acetylglutamate kinase|uniref:Acetylglutamate kinase n=1 Tax=Sphingobacterium allocomposti TaxID=415956 RepID=A0A5S5D861_9SPHI|nr:acetylglutamate kinase [Sphingobacterium composti Yoo et al. 2007 non Ten et al. 2007]TYP91518.1 N-acetylglutamate kinase [Sphingobacterium composti Yoo et al. 2007 non Ten et al. 2007]HLS94196.1 acetylglutamate kinase [Sphingobacterium sp.]
MGSVLNIIKIGGNVIDDEEQLQSFLEKFAALQGKKILVHGGGKIATRVASGLGIEAKMVNGRRITDEAMLDVVTMVYAGLTNKKVVSSLQKFGCDAVGLSGADGNTIKAVKRPVKEIDYGYVGDILVDSVNLLSIKKFLEAGFTPVFSAITHNGLGQLLNTNADTIASALAVSLSKIFETRLIYCFEKNGVLRDVEDPNSVIKSIHADEFQQLVDSGTIYEGMIPKLENAFHAIGKGVKNVYIGNALNLHLYQQGEFGTCLLGK